MANIFALDDVNEVNDEVTRKLLFRYYDWTYVATFYEVIKDSN